MNRALTSITSLGVAAILVAACSGSEEPSDDDDGGSSGNTSGAGGSSGTGGAKGGSSGSPAGGTGNTSGTSPAGGSSGSTAGNTPGGSAGTSGASSGSTGSPGGAAGTSGGSPPVGGQAGTAGTDAGGQAGIAGTAGTGEPPVELPPLVTSAPNAYWKIDGTLTEGSGAATVTVNDTQVAQTWDGFGGSFNEKGWAVLTSDALKMEAVRLLFGAEDGCNFSWGRIPMGASDYGNDRYTLDDTGTDRDPMAMSGDGNRPPADLQLANFSLARDDMLLIPYIKAAQGVKPSLRFWASPWTPPVWMKTGYMTTSGGSDGGNADRPSYFDGGDMKTDSATLASYAQYYVKFVEGYRGKGINVEVVSPQNEPGYPQNYPSCLWDSATYTTFIGTHLGPAMAALTPPVDIMLGTMSNSGDSGRDDNLIAQAVMANSTARGFLSVAGAQWGVLDDVKAGSDGFGDLPVWATEHKCGNYPWNPTGYPAYVMTAPNDQAYAVESWGYLKGAIVQGRVTAYNAWNMVLDNVGLGNDTSRHWAQNALLTVNGNTITKTPTYHVFRHIAQYVVPGAQAVGTTGGDALAFKNPDGSLVAVMFNSGGANATYSVALGGKTFSFAMPGNGWATVKYKP